MTRVLILDQFAGPTPYWLQQHPTPFEELVREVEADPKRFTIFFGQRPEVVEVTDDFRPTLCTTVYHADANGNAEAWRWHWDSSG